MKPTKTINVWNDFYKEKFEELCKELEQGETVATYVDCIGHTRNNYTQEHYKEELLKKYGNRLEMKKSDGAYSYHYTYKLKSKTE